MQTASITKVDTKKDSPTTEIKSVAELPREFFDYFTWSKKALCSGVQITMFYTASSAGMAKVICGSCPVKDECLIWALMYKEEGIWGGTTEDERKSLVPKYNISALTARAVHLGLYFPKRSAQEIRESFAQAV